MPKVLRDEPNGDAFLEQVRGIAMPEGMRRGFGFDAAGGEREAEGVLHRTLVHWAFGPESALVERLLVRLPVHLHPRKEVLGMTMSAPETAQLGNHLRCDRHIAILAALGIAYVQAAGVRFDVDDLEPAGFTNAQPGVIDQPQDRAKAIALHRTEQASDFYAGEHGRQRFQTPDFEFLPKLPISPGAQMLAVESPQGGKGQRDRTGRIVPFVAQEEEVVAYLRFVECCRVTSEVAADQDDVAQVGFARPWSQIAQLDIAAKLVYGWIVRMRSSR